MMVVFIEGFVIIGGSCFEMYKLIFVYVCGIDNVKLCDMCTNVIYKNYTWP